MLKANACVGCGKCECICGAHALTMTEVAGSPKTWRVVRQLPHVACLSCGHPSWLDYCLNCRSQVMEIPHHNTLVTLRKAFLQELKDLFVQSLWLA